MDHNRPVLDVVHERETGKLRVRVNDGRLVETTRSAVEINLNDVGAVLFNPKVQVCMVYVLFFAYRVLC